MKAKLEFDLDDFDDRMSHERCVKALDMALVLWEITNNSRKRILNGADESVNFEDFEKGVTAVFDEIYSLLEEHSVTPDKLVV
jgi:hypothetical protein